LQPDVSGPGKGKEDVVKIFINLRGATSLGCRFDF